MHVLVVLVVNETWPYAAGFRWAGGHSLLSATLACAGEKPGCFRARETAHGATRGTAASGQPQ